MRPASLTASMAVLLLSSTALLAQEAEIPEDVYIDVGGSAVLIPAELAMEACGLDEAGVREVIAGGAADLGTTMTAHANATTDAGNRTTDLGNRPAGADGTATAEGGAAVIVLGPDATATADAGLAAAEPGLAEDGVEDVEFTAAETDPVATDGPGTGDPVVADDPGEELVALSVCRIDVVRASELGIRTLTDEPITEDTIVD